MDGLQTKKAHFREPLLLGYEPTPNRWTTAQKVEIYFPPARTKKALKLHKFQ
jgi:hypothetical protein